MNTKIIKFDLNKNLYDTLIAKQGDTKSRFLLFNLLDGSIPFSLENRSVRVYAIKPDRTEVFNDLIITDAAKGYCILELTTQMLAVAGTVKLELMVMEGDKKLTSNIFYMDVKESINSEKAVVSTNEFGTLLTALASLNEYDNYKNEIKNARGGQVNLKTRLDNFDEHLDTNKNELIDKINEVATKGTTTEVLQATTETYIQEKINDGTIANLTIEENSITEDRLKYDYSYTLVRENFKELNYELTVNGTQQDGTLHFTMFVDLQPLLSMLDGTECFSISTDITPTNTNIAGVKCQIFSNNDSVLDNFTGGQHIVMKFLDILGGTNKLNYSDISTIAFNKSYRYARIVFTFNPYDLETQLNFIINNLKINLGEINVINLIDKFSFLGATSQSSSTINTTKVYNLNNDLVVRKSLFDSKITEIDNKILSISGDSISKWTNKKWAVVGDSITAKTFRAEYNYHDYIKELINCNVVNFGISGTGFTTAVSPIYNRIDSIDLDTDLITVFAGVNDHGQGVGSLGVFGDNDTSTLYGAIRITIEKLINRFPNKHIAFFTPLPYSGNWGNNPSNNSNGYNIVDVRNAIIETCNNYSIPVLDLYNISNLRPWNTVNNKEYFSCDYSPEGDGLHPNDKGHRHLADIILNFLNSL